MRGWFVTGTDTGVGKTFVTATLAREIRESGVRVAAIKPAESGCRADSTAESGLYADDAEVIAGAAGDWQGAHERCLFRFAEPVAPGVAAERLGQSIDFAAIQEFVRAVGSRADRSLVEGAGGWLVPFGGGRLLADLAVLLALPVVVVARAGLGTISQSLLTLESIEARRMSVAAVVLSMRPEEDLAAARSNAAEIERHWGAAGTGRVWILAGGAATAWDVERPRPTFHVERG